MAALRPHTDRPGPASRPPSANRYGSTALTFGLPMRIVLTVLVTVPAVLFLWLGIRFGGVVLTVLVLIGYSGFLYPRLMKDIWRRTDRPLR
jgi:hypothetical protein